MAEAILALNAGSSSLKFGLFTPSTPLELRPLAIGAIEAVDGQTRLRAATSGSRVGSDDDWTPVRYGTSVDHLLGWISDRFPTTPLGAVGHRVVHGGREFSDPVEIDENILERLDRLTPLAPLHQPASLEPARLVKDARPDLRQFACFDTAFHRTIIPPASRYALPRALEAEGIRRYGFHGLSYESIAAQLKWGGGIEVAKPDSRIIVAHLGNGASLCAMRGLKSVDTTMGFSALDGLVMGTRPGSLDPGILLYLLQSKAFSAARLEQLLYRECGLLGVSGISSDVATLQASDDPVAVEALDLFAFQAARQAAGLAASLGGIDRFIFTGGIGEHSPMVRKMIADRLRWLGADLDEEANTAGATIISSSTSTLLLECRSTQEEMMIARHVLSRLRG